MAAPIHSPRVASRANMPSATRCTHESHYQLVRLPPFAYRTCLSYAHVTTQPTSARTTEGGVNGTLSKQNCKAAKLSSIFSSLKQLFLRLCNQGTEAPFGAP